MHSSEDADADLTKARKRLFEIVLNRLRQLHSFREPPEFFYIGQSYVEDTETCSMEPGRAKASPRWESNKLAPKPSIGRPRSTGERRIAVPRRAIKANV
jgi:hypothetical protein